MEQTHREVASKKMIRAVTVACCSSMALLILTASMPAQGAQTKEVISLKEDLVPTNTAFVLDTAYSTDNTDPIATASTVSTASTATEGTVSTTDLVNTLPVAVSHPNATVQGQSVSLVLLQECEPFKPQATIVAHEAPMTQQGTTIVPNIDTVALNNVTEFKTMGTMVNTSPNVITVSNIEFSGLTNEPIQDTVVDVYEAQANGLPQTHGITNNKVLLQAVTVDPNYVGRPLPLTGANRDNFERLVMGEAGDEGYEGAALVAQALRDTMFMTGNTDTLSIKKRFAYSGRLGRTPNEDVKRACQFILDEGGSAVQHRIIYFYAPKYVRGGVSNFHETQEFIIEHRGHRVFDMR